MDLGWPEVLLILAIVLIVFGAGKLPQVGSALGKGIREFRKAQRGEDEDKETTTVVERSVPGSPGRSAQSTRYPRYRVARLVRL